MAIEAINPATGKLIKSFKEYSPSEVKKILDDVNTAFLSWRNTAFEERAMFMKNAAQILKDKKDYYAKIMALEMGKPIKQGRAEIEKCASVCEYYAENAERILDLEIIESDASKSYARFDPIGTVLAVMPWNFPFWQVFRFAAPALMAGNTGVLKHASNVPQCALEIENLFRDAGFPEFVSNLNLYFSSKFSILRP